MEPASAELYHSLFEADATEYHFSLECFASGTFTFTFRATMGGAAADPKEQPAQPQWPSSSQTDCERMVERAQTRNMTVKFMLDKMDEVKQLPNQRG